MTNKKVEKALNEQINIEEYSSRIYVAMASWCEANAYPGSALYMYKQADEERFHQLKFMKYVNDREGHAILQSSEQPEIKFKSLIEVFEKALKHEKFVSASINKLYGICLDEKDYTSSNFVQWFVNEQIEEESNARGILDKFKLLGKKEDSMYLIDKELEAKGLAKVVPSIYNPIV